MKTLIWIVAITLTLISCTQNEDVIISEAQDTETTSSNEQYNCKEKEITLYKINGENITRIKNYEVTGKNLDFQNDINKHQEIWNLVKKIIPANQRERITEFLIYNGSNSKTLGYVSNRSRDLSKWQLAIAIDYAYKGGFNKNGLLSYIIVHEFGHILTLNETQIIRGKNNCNTYKSQLGCSKQDSYLNNSFQSYWKDIWNEHRNSQNSEASKDAFYRKHTNRFVTKYAAKNPLEDIAETFSMFVLYEKPNSNIIASKKVLSMYNKTEFVAFRNHIRQNLNTTSKGAETGFILPNINQLKFNKDFNEFECAHKH